MSRSLALEHLVDVHYETVLKFLVRLTGCVSAAEDLAQTTFSGLVVSWHPLGSEAENRRYVMKAAYHAWCRRSRDRWPDSVDPQTLRGFAAAERGPDARVAFDEDVERVHAALMELPSHQQAALILIVLEQMSYRDAAELMDVPRDTVSKWRTRGLARLRHILMGDEDAHLVEAG